MSKLSMFDPGGCCCVDLCILWSDNFDRSSVGSNWTNYAGTWTAATTGGGQVSTSSSNAELDQAGGSDGSLATVTVSGSGQMQVGLGAAGSFVGAELDTGGSTFSLVLMDSGTRTVLRQCPCSDSSATIAIGSDTYPYGDGTFRLFTGYLNGTPTLTWGDEVGECETFGGCIATATLSGTATFTNYSMSESAGCDAGCPQGPQCCWPLVDPLPSTMTVVVSGIGGAATGVGLDPCTDEQCAALNGTYVVSLTSGLTASYAGCPTIPCCAGYQLTGLDLPCNTSSPYPITTANLLIFNCYGSSCQEGGQCNIYFQLCIATGFVDFQFDLGLGEAPPGFFPSEADGTYSTTQGCGNSVTLYANNSAASPTPGGLRCQYDSLDDPPPATAVVTY